MRKSYTGSKCLVLYYIFNTQRKSIMNYRIVSIGDKWYVQSETGKYLGGYTSRKLAENLLRDLEAAE